MLLFQISWMMRRAHTQDNFQDVSLILRWLRGQQHKNTGENSHLKYEILENLSKSHNLLNHIVRMVASAASATSVFNKCLLKHCVPINKNNFLGNIMNIPRFALHFAQSATSVISCPQASQNLEMWETLHAKDISRNVAQAFKVRDSLPQGSFKCCHRTFNI